MQLRTGLLLISLSLICAISQASANSPTENNESAGACETSNDQGNHYCVMTDKDTCIQAFYGIFYDGQSC